MLSVEQCGCHMALHRASMEMKNLLWNALKHKQKLIDSKTIAKNNLRFIDCFGIYFPEMTVNCFKGVV